MFAEEFASKVDFHPFPAISLQSVELEEAVLGAILLDPVAIAHVEELPIQAFSISAHQEIFKTMLELHRSGLQPDLLTVAFHMNQWGTLKSIGGQLKLASLLDRTVSSVAIKQYASLLQQKYQRRYLSDSISAIARLVQTKSDFSSVIAQAQQQLEKIRTVTGDTSNSGDISILDPAKFSATVTTVTKIIEQGLPDWEEQAQLDAFQLQSGISKAAFWQFVSSLRCQFDEVMPDDAQQLGQLIEWKDAKLNLPSVLPHLAEDLLHDAQVLNIDPLMLWQYLLPATLSLAGKKVELDVASHRVPSIAWTCIVGESGTGKSRAEGLILSPLKAWQQEEHLRFKAEWQEHKLSKNQKDDVEQVAAPLPERKFLFEVATIQAVMKRLSEQGENGSLWARDELAGLFKSLGQFTAKGEGEGLECLLPMWDGTSAPVDRVMHEDSYYLASSRLSIAGGLQPGVFRKIFTDPDDPQGLQARFLFALPKVQPAKRVKGYCRLADKLPSFYRWVNTQFPAGTVKLSRAADARYDTVYEQIGRQAELAETPAIRAWMRKLPGQLLRIALALHIIECYHEPQRPRHELQVDTLNRAVNFCRYYRSTFQLVQQSVSDSDAVSSILLKIWDLAATSPTGLAVRDAYRSIKALARRAKEQGRNVAAYTMDLYYQLEKMGRGTIERCGRSVRLIAGANSAPTTPQGGDKQSVTMVTVPRSNEEQGLEVSPPDEVSPVTEPNLKQMNVVTDDIDVSDLSSMVDSGASLENLSTSNESNERLLGNKIMAEVELNAEQSTNAEPSASTSATMLELDNSDKSQLLKEDQLQEWLTRIAAVRHVEECMDCLDALNSLPAMVVEQIWTAASEFMPRFWAVAEIDATDELPHHSPGTHASSLPPKHHCNGTDDHTFTSHESGSDTTPSQTQLLKIGMWVRTLDGFYGYLGSMLQDGRWWVLSPKTRSSDAQSRLYTAADVIPMSTS